MTLKQQKDLEELSLHLIESGIKLLRCSHYPTNAGSELGIRGVADLLDVVRHNVSAYQARQRPILIAPEDSLPDVEDDEL